MRFIHTLTVLVWILAISLTSAQEPPTRPSLDTPTPDTPNQQSSPSANPEAKPQTKVNNTELTKSEPTKSELTKSEKLPLSGLAPAKLVPNLCVYRYRVSTNSPECQALVDQGLGYYHSYVWMEAARSFETAARIDPDCAVAWWGLSRSLEKWNRPTHTKALERAKEVMDRVSPRERLLVQARLQEKGLWPNTPPEERKKAAARSLDELLILYPDDEEAWYARAQISEGQAGVPYYHALLRINPLHPGANHELVHFYENIRRPGLGWANAEKYIESSPGIPHAFHMQAHLATRLGKWDKTSDRSARAIELQRTYHKEMNVQPRDDHQYSHHLEILTLSLIHDGRFVEARAIKQESWDAGFRHWVPWFRLHLAERDYDAAQKVVEGYRKGQNKTGAAYLAALLALAKGEMQKANAELDVLRQAIGKRKNDRTLEYQLNEVQGLILCKSGAVDEGLKLIERSVEKSKSDYGHHAWGNGAYHMEVWGIAALEAGRLEVAEEAFLEALAHDPGSVRGALGLAVICQRLGRTDEQQRYEALARRFWSRAEVRHFDALRDELNRLIPTRVEAAAPQ